MIPHLLLIAATLTTGKVLSTDDHFEVVVRAHEALSPDGVRARMTGNGLEFTVPHMTLGQPAMVIAETPSLLVGRERETGTLFMATLPAGRTCHEPFDITSAADGLHVVPTCDGPTPAAAVVEKPGPVVEAPKNSVIAASVMPSAGIPDSGTPGRGVMGLFLVLGGAALGAFLLKKRKSITRALQVIETINLGPKRSLVLVRVGQDVLTLAMSEAGVSLLSTRPADEPSPMEHRNERPHAEHFRTEQEEPPRSEPAPSAAASLASRAIGRLKLHRGGESSAPSFESLLAESHEDQELRRKLAAGLAGRVA